jgi:quinol monooxygenase YgiN
MNVIVFASFTPKPEEFATVQQILAGMVTETRKEAGNLVYDLYKSTGEPATLHIFEVYEDAAALDAHRASEHYKAYRAKITDYLAEPIGVKVLQGIDAG